MVFFVVKRYEAGNVGRYQNLFNVVLNADVYRIFRKWVKNALGHNYKMNCCDALAGLNDEYFSCFVSNYF